MAQRSFYGIKDKESTLYDSKNQNSLWVWEIINPSLLPSTGLYSKTKKLFYQSKIKALNALLKKISKIKKKTELISLINTHNNYMNYVRKEKFSEQKAREINSENSGKKSSGNKRSNLASSTIFSIHRVLKRKDSNAGYSDENSCRIKESDSADKMQSSLLKYVKQTPIIKQNIAKEEIHKVLGDDFLQCILKKSSIKGEYQHVSNASIFKGRIKFFNFNGIERSMKQLNIKEPCISPLTPFMKISDIDYTVETDEEYAELDADDIKSDEEEEYDFDDGEDELDDESNFIVPDDYVEDSSEKIMFDCKKTPRKETEIESFHDFRIDNEETQSKSIKYKIVALRNLPISITKKKEKLSKTRLQKNDQQLNMEKHFKDLICMAHGSYFKKDMIVNEFHTAYPIIHKITASSKLKGIICRRHQYVIM